LRLIISETKEDIQSLLDRIWLAIENIATPPSNRYGDVLKHSEKELYAASIVEHGNYWEKVKAALTQKELDSIETNDDEWIDERQF
jgi:hypothetical protein